MSVCACVRECACMCMFTWMWLYTYIHTSLHSLHISMSCMSFSSFCLLIIHALQWFVCLFQLIDFPILSISSLNYLFTSPLCIPYVSPLTLIYFHFLSGFFPHHGIYHSICRLWPIFSSIYLCTALILSIYQFQFHFIKLSFSIYRI